MPNRMLKESMRYSEKINALTDFQFRLWTSLLTYVDDYGRGDARTPVIKGACFPLRERVTNKDIDAALAGLAGVDCVRLYEVDGKPYLYFPNWDEHQTVRNKRSKFPEPPAHLNANENNCNHLNANVSVIQTNKNPKPNPNKGADRADKSPFEIAMDDFAKARKAMKKPLTDKARELTITELEKLAPGDEAMQIAILNQSIQRGWQGVFPLKEDEPIHAQQKKAPEKPVSWKDGPTYLPDWAEDE